MAGLLFDGGAIALAIDGGEWTFVTARETDEAGGVDGELLVSGEREFGFAGFGGDVAEFSAGDEAAKILIAGLVFGEEGEAVRRCLVWGGGGVDFGTDEGADAVFFGGTMETRGTVNAMSVCEGHGGLFEMPAAGGEVFGDGGAFEEGERGTGMVFDEGWGHGIIIGEEKTNLRRSEEVEVRR